VEDQSAPIPEERTSELGGIIKLEIVSANQPALFTKTSTATAYTLQQYA
jgi:hypothetical protein